MFLGIKKQTEKDDGNQLYLGILIDLNFQANVMQILLKFKLNKITVKMHYTSMDKLSIFIKINWVLIISTHSNQ